ncbi:diguanylate cyclase (GGDEF) domain-containing protein [Thermoleophilum album]|uniref:Diguanylate cyclase (GGDEF) domain-containing protein n=1 Tax=Thermoleophilum album TaxID=29539 RepID=A0A1H6FL84_THEAL|nr:diguanylate cyclase (GGDEF) domain-containing protein [Thermoleophilum album]
MQQEQRERARANTLGGLACSLIAYVLTVPYIVATWERPNRSLMLAALCAVLVEIAVISVLPLRVVFKTSLRAQLIAAAWSLSCVTLVAFNASLDGGLDSPLTPLMFVPVVFASLVYETWLVAIVGAVGLGAAAAVGLLDGDARWTETFVFCGAVAVVSGTCVWQATMARRRREELAMISRTDPLTGCLNRRGFAEQFEAARERARRTRGTFALIEFDIDDFKRVNDVYGHETGDRLLVQLVRRMRQVVRTADPIGRLGGDEFMVLADGADRPGAERLAQRIRSAIAPQVISVGISVFPEDGESFDALYRAADRRVYREKQEHQTAARER